MIHFKIYIYFKSFQLIRNMWWWNYSLNLSSKTKFWKYLLINSLRFYNFFFFAYQVEGYWNRLKLSWRPLAFTSRKIFLKKRRSATSPLSHFLHNFWRKWFLLVIYSITWPNFVAWLPLLCETLGNMYIVIVC